MSYIKTRWNAMQPKSVLESVQLLAISLFCLECVVGGAGRIIHFGYFSLRMFLFTVCFLLTLPCVWAKRRELLKRPYTWIWAAFFVVLFLYALRGYQLGSTLSYIRQDLTLFLTLLLFPGFISLIDHKRERVNWLVDLVFVGAVIVGIATVLLHLLLAFEPESFAKRVDYLLNTTSCGGLAVFGENYYRVYLKSQMFLQIGTVIGLYKMIMAKQRKHWLVLLLWEAIQVYAMILSGTRGFWLGVAVSCVMVAVLRWQNIRAYLKALAGLIVSIAILFGISQIAYGTPVTLFAFADRIGIPVESHILDAGKNSDGAGSVAAQEFAKSMREKTWNELHRLISEKPLTGYGLGKNLDGIRTYADDGRPEYMYQDIYMKLGLVGFVLFMAVFCLHDGQILVRSFKRRKLADESVDLYVAAGYTGLLVTSYLNPFLTSTMGITALLIVIAVADTSDMTTQENTQNV